jgi:hypothetical protein
VNKGEQMMIVGVLLLAGCSGGIPGRAAFSVDVSTKNISGMVFSTIEITSKVDSLSITDVVVNRGNCKVEHSHELGLQAALLTPRGQTLKAASDAADARREAAYVTFNSAMATAPSDAVTEHYAAINGRCANAGSLQSLCEANSAPIRTDAALEAAYVESDSAEKNKKAVNDADFKELEKIAATKVSNFPVTLKFGEVFRPNISSSVPMLFNVGMSDCKISEVAVSSDNGDMTSSY